MKRSAKGEQVLDMNAIDFERASGGKNIKFGFPALTMNNGRSDIEQRNTPLANDLVIVLQENNDSALMMNFKQFEFSMNKNFQLTIKNTTLYI